MSIFDLPDWQLDAACRGSDPSLFFPARGEGRGYTEQAKRICAGCAVQPECLEWAVTNREPFGVWGGLSERQRRRVRKERAA